MPHQKRATLHFPKSSPALESKQDAPESLPRQNPQMRIGQKNSREKMNPSRLQIGI